VAKDSSGLAEKVNKSIRSIQAAQADIICIQEMYDFPGVRPFHIIKTLKKAGYSHVFFSISEKNWGSRIGMAILSRHPILEEEIIRKKVGSNNQIILARIRIGDRRISVINMHLQSVALREKEFRLARESGEWVDRGLSIGKKLKKGFQNRAGQLDELLKAAAEEGDYVLICGDLNDTPYSNSYLRLRDQYQNAFEEAGRGFGFTFNGEIPFLRIDNQFAGKGFRVSRFDTRKDFPASDHYGTEACYAFKE
jgi:endonuclease/exonuclease/phosphatase family metal-dependent hydrolase